MFYPFYCLCVVHDWFLFVLNFFFFFFFRILISVNKRTESEMWTNMNKETGWRSFFVAFWLHSDCIYWVSVIWIDIRHFFFFFHYKVKRITRERKTLMADTAHKSEEVKLFSISFPHFAAYIIYIRTKESSLTHQRSFHESWTSLQIWFVTAATFLHLQEVCWTIG